MERKTGGWLSSVVDNISGLWSRSPSGSAASLRDNVETRNYSRNSSYEEQDECDVGEDNDGIIVEAVRAGASASVPSTSNSRKFLIFFNDHCFISGFIFEAYHILLSSHD